MKTLLLAASRSRRLQGFAEANVWARRLSRRFVAGATWTEALAAVASISRQGLVATLDPLGENTRTEAQARLACEEACADLRRLAAAGLPSGISVKLTQLGLDLDRALALELLRKIARHAAEYRRFVRVDMESTAYTDRTLDLVEAVHAAGLPVGTVIQSYLRRSGADVSRLLRAGISIRLVKGAYDEPASLAYRHKAEVDREYVRLAELLLASSGKHAIATHDPAMIAATLAAAARLGAGAERFEFQMLYGIRRDLQRQLQAQGWRVRLYVPYGQEWYPYFMRRVAERPANLIFLLRQGWRR